MKKGQTKSQRTASKGKKPRSGRGVGGSPGKRPKHPGGNPGLLGKTFKILIIATIFGAALLMFTVWRIGISIEERLASRELADFAAVYSDTFLVHDGQRLPDQVLLQALKSRQYREVDFEPDKPGEYRVQKVSGQLAEYSILTRPFLAPDGQKIATRFARIVPATGSIRVGTNSGALVLEPVMVAPLGSGELRADRYVPLSETAKILIDAVLATEDTRFYSHFGVDPLGIGRAMFTNLVAGRLAQGGSTLTQQLVKNLFLSPEKTITRKVKELVAAIALERKLSKEEILELYLNEIYLGQEGAVALHGFAEATRAFFGKKLSELNLSEAATLAGIIRAPSYYSPRRHPKRAKERRDVVLNAMFEQGRISDLQLQEALAHELVVSEEPVYRSTASYFVTALRRELEPLLDFDAAVSGGMKIYSGLSPEVQRCAESAVANGLKRLEERNPRLRRKDQPLEAGLVALDPFSGKVRAWVGGRDFKQRQFDHVSQARRQLGSSIKPFLYLTAVDRQRHPQELFRTVSVLPDRPIAEEKNGRRWEPQNYDREFRGDVTLRYALENSLNMPSIFLAERIGLKNFAATLINLRLAKSDLLVVPSLALGALDTTLLQATTAFAALANGGNYIAPRIFISATDGEGEIIARSRIYEESVATAGGSYVVTDMLRGVVERGTARSIRSIGYEGPAAGKTGTSDDARDAWFIGYAPNFVAGVWVGFDNNHSTGLTGGSAAAPIWGEFMKCAATEAPGIMPAVDDFTVPKGVVFREVDPATGFFGDESCQVSAGIREVFTVDNLPPRACGAVDDDSNNRGSEGPGRRRDQRSFWERIF